MPPSQPSLDERQKEVFHNVTIVARPCPTCGADNRDTPASPYSLGMWTVKTCASCDLTYIDSAPVYEALFAQISWEKSTKLETERRNLTQPLQQKLSKKLRFRTGLFPRRRMPELLDQYAKPGNVVDLGCGDGGQLAGIAPAFVPYGVEISTELAEKASRNFAPRGGHAVNAPSLVGLQEFPPAFFTAATLRSYLEHEMNPREVLTELHRTLKPGGIAIVKVPNFGSLNRRVMGGRWCGFRYPDHLNYFTPATLRKLAADCGYSTWFGLTWRLPTSDNMWAILRKTHAAIWLAAANGLGGALHLANEAALLA